MLIQQFINQLSQLMQAPIFKTPQVNISIGILIIAMIFTIVIYYLRNIPIMTTINNLLGFFPTLIHELGHALICSITFGKVNDIRVILLNSNKKKKGANGYAEMSHKLWIGEVLTAIAGYVFPSFIILALVYFTIQHQLIIFFILFAVLMLYYLIKTRQKLVAITVILILFASSLNLMEVNEESLIMIIEIIINSFLGVMIAHIIISIITRFNLTFLNHNEDWDGGQLKKLTFIPQSLWCIAWFVFDIIIIYNIIRLIGVSL